MLDDCTAFVFDLDGTLVTTDLDFPAMKAAVVSLAGRRGVPPEVLQPLDILSALEHACSVVSDADALRADAEAALAAFEVEGARRNREMPGAVHTLRTLMASGRRVGIVTRNCRAAVVETLSRVPLPYDALLTRSDVPRAKPHPDHLQRMLLALAADPATSVMVGDHWMDVQAGRQAGMRTVGVLGNHETTRFEHLPPDFLVAGPLDLLAFLSCA